MQSTFIHIRRYTMTSILLIICCKMLDTCHHALTLKTDDIVCRYLSGQIRILSEILKITATKRGTVYICSRPKQYMHSTCTRILSECYTHLVYKITVPRCCSCNTARIKSTLCVVSHTLRSICHPDCWKSEAVNGTDVPVFKASDIFSFFLKSHLRHYLCCSLLIFLGKPWLSNTDYAYKQTCQHKNIFLHIKYDFIFTD